MAERFGRFGFLARGTDGADLWMRLTRFASWFGVSLIHALGNPEEERRFQPPLLGVQPYRDRPYRAAR
jgi:hypothetical protein